MDYANDIAFLANAPAQAKALLKSLEWAAAGIGLANKTEYLCFNLYKTEYMCFNLYKMEYMCFNQTADILTVAVWN